MDTPKPSRTIPSSKNNQREHRTSKPRFERKKFAWTVVTPDKTVWRVHADTEIEALEQIAQKTNQIPVSITKVVKPFVRKDHLTARPFQDLRNMMKEAN